HPAGRGEESVRHAAPPPRHRPEPPHARDHRAVLQRAGAYLARDEARRAVCAERAGSSLSRSIVMTRIAAFVLGLLVLLGATGARAEYPDRAVRIVVPVAAGGGVDVMARMLTQKLSERLGQQFVVENRAGAAGVIGSKVVIASPPDGATLLYT